jgi:hypothetical protein
VVAIRAVAGDNTSGVGFSSAYASSKYTAFSAMPDRITEAELERIYDATIAELYGYVSRRCGGTAGIGLRTSRRRPGFARCAIGGRTERRTSRWVG